MFTRTVLSLLKMCSFYFIIIIDILLFFMYKYTIAIAWPIYVPGYVYVYMVAYIEIINIFPLFVQYQWIDNTKISYSLADIQFLWWTHIHLTLNSIYWNSVDNDKKIYACKIVSYIYLSVYLLCVVFARKIGSHVCVVAQNNQQ